MSMTHQALGLVLAQGGELSTGGFQNWLTSNIIPLVLLAVALLLLWLGGGKGDNAGVMKRLAGVVIALGILGLAVGGMGISVGQWIAGLFTG